MRPDGDGPALRRRIVRGAGFRQPVFRSQIERGGKGDIAAARFAFQAGLDPVETRQLYTSVFMHYIVAH